MTRGVIVDNWQPSACKHGVIPKVEQEFIDWNYGTYMGKMPTYKSLWYDCPTPNECALEAYGSAPRHEEKT